MVCSYRSAAIVLSLISPIAVRSDDAVRMEERLAVGTQYHVSCRGELAGTLTAEQEKGKTSKPLPLKGESAMEYDERVLTVDAAWAVQKTARIYRQIDFQRTVAERAQQQTIRPAV